MPQPDVVIAITSDRDVVEARQKGRALAAELGFSAGEAALIATAISELSRNIVSYATRGEVLIRPCVSGSRSGLLIVASDDGPGIADQALAMRDGYSSSGGLGLGLPGVRRLMDEFELVSGPAIGTRVTVRRWRT